MWNGFWNWLATLPEGSASFVGSLTGSTIGLIALLVGALFNAHLNRKRDDKLRDEDRRAVASTLYAELQGIHRALIENAQHLEKRPPNASGGFVVPEPSMKLLPATLSRMGLLQSHTIRKVLDAYILSEQYTEELILYGGKPQPDRPANRRAVYLEANDAKFLIEFNRARAGPVKDAMEALAPYLN